MIRIKVLNNISDFGIKELQSRGCEVGFNVTEPHGILVLESAEPEPLGVNTPLAERFEVLKSARYGVAYVNILTPKA